MIKLKLNDDTNSFESVLSLPGLQGLVLDKSYGLVPIDPSNALFVVRTTEINDLEWRKKMSPEIIDAYGDIRISTV